MYETLPFDVTEVGYMAYKKGFATHMHTDEYEFHYLPRAHCTIRNSRRRVRLPDHSLVFTEPGAEHGIVLSQGEAAVCWYYFRFRLHKHRSDILPALRKAFDSRGYVRLGPPFDARLRDMLVRLQSTDTLLCISGAYQFAAFIYEIAWDGWKQSLIRASSHVDELIGQMQQTVAGKLELGKVSAAMGIDKSYLIRLFKKRTGLSPVKYFNRMKIDTASHLLQRTRLPVREIAEQLGFCDEFYFSRLFKQYMGVAPLAFRAGRA